MNRHHLSNTELTLKGKNLNELNTNYKSQTVFFSINYYSNSGTIAYRTTAPDYNDHYPDDECGFEHKNGYTMTATKAKKNANGTSNRDEQG